MIFGINSASIVAVLLSLIAFGALYNELIGWAEKHHYLEGFTSIAVAVGVLVTLVGVSLLSMQAALIALGAFVASGTPMIVGSIIRYVAKRAAVQKALIEEARNATRTPLA
jgi:hypothetical protein